MDINKSEVKRITLLSSLCFTEKDLKLYQNDLISIVNFFDKLKEVNTDDIQPLCNNITDNLRLKRDEVIKENTKEEIFKNVPKSKYDFFVVPKMIE